MRERAPAAERTIVVDVADADAVEALAGPGQQNLRALALALGAHVGARSNAITLQGASDRVELGRAVVEALARIAKKTTLHPSDVAHAVKALEGDPGTNLRDVFLDVVVEARGGRAVTPKGAGQKAYVDAIRAHDMVLCTGPAGTGKTYLAMALAVDALHKRAVQRIVLTRPAVEAGEKLGFLPGDLAEKVNPYLRPLYDALDDLMGPREAAALLVSRALEVAPLAFMRGRTLADAFVILDEAQNTTREQMKMFLTRTGFGSKVVVTGDLTQTDLPRGVVSGYADAVRTLRGVEGIGFVELSDRDVVRHPLVSRILQAYDASAGASAAPSLGAPDGEAPRPPRGGGTR